MTTPHVTSRDFGGSLVPPEVQARIINLLVDGSPFANSLTRLPVTSTKVTWPTAQPSGFAWVDELSVIPTVAMGDNAYTAVVAKIAGLLDLSNEMVSDTSINVTAVVGQLLADGLGHDLDSGLLSGSGVPPNPQGVIGIATAVTGAGLLAAVTAAKGQIGDAGGHADTIAASATALATADGSVGTDGHMLFPAGFGAAVGLTPVAVPGLATPLVYDSTRLFLVVNGQQSDVAISTDFRFDKDATTLRVRARVAAGVRPGQDDPEADRHRHPGSGGGEEVSQPAQRRGVNPGVTGAPQTRGFPVRLAPRRGWPSRREYATAGFSSSTRTTTSPVDEDVLRECAVPWYRIGSTI